MSEAAEICRKLGGDWSGRSGIAPCPVCQPERRRNQRALSIRSDGTRLLLHCHKSGCRFQDLISAAGIQLIGSHSSSPEALADRASSNLSAADKMWGKSVPIIGTPGERYLRSRGITCRLPETIRWNGSVWHGPSQTLKSAIVARVTTGAVHRTYVDQHGMKLKHDAKLMLGPTAGGAVPLSEANGALVVCEGVENGLSLLSGLLTEPATVWAALSAPGLRSVNLPEPAGRLIIALDNDEAGLSATDALAFRAHHLGWEVVMLHPQQGLDWNDILQQRQRS